MFPPPYAVFSLFHFVLLLNFCKTLVVTNKSYDIIPDIGLNFYNIFVLKKCLEISFRLVSTFHVDILQGVGVAGVGIEAFDIGPECQGVHPIK